MMYLQPPSAMKLVKITVDLRAKFTTESERKRLQLGQFHLLLRLPHRPVPVLPSHAEATHRPLLWCHDYRLGYCHNSTGCHHFVCLVGCLPLLPRRFRDMYLARTDHTSRSVLDTQGTPAALDHLVGRCWCGWLRRGWHHVCRLERIICRSQVCYMAGMFSTQPPKHLVESRHLLTKRVFYSSYFSFLGLFLLDGAYFSFLPCQLRP